MFIGIIYLIIVSLFYLGKWTDICLPAWPCVSDDNVRYIVECVKEAVVK